MLERVLQRSQMHLLSEQQSGKDCMSVASSRIEEHTTEPSDRGGS